MRRKLWIPFLLLIAILFLYLWPVPHPSAAEIYANVAPQTVQALTAFRQAHPLKTLEVEGIHWEYIAVGQGEEAVIFLHGMTGAADIWWRQISALEGQYRVIAVTYPAVSTLAEMERGVLAILNAEGVGEFNVVGTSLGGYFAQYLVAKHPDRIRRAVLANTFPPNDLLAEKNKAIGAVLPYLPEWLVMSVLRGSFRNGIYPASGYDELTLAMLSEMGYGRMSKAQVVGRYRCVIEKFDAPTPRMPVMILEAANDPLVEPALREQLTAAYPKAIVHNLGAVGHFPYLNVPETYTRLLLEFLTVEFGRTR